MIQLPKLESVIQTKTTWYFEPLNNRASQLVGSASIAQLHTVWMGGSVEEALRVRTPTFAMFPRDTDVMVILAGLDRDLTLTCETCVFHHRDLCIQKESSSSFLARFSRFGVDGAEIRWQRLLNMYPAGGVRRGQILPPIRFSW